MIPFKTFGIPTSFYIFAYYNTNHKEKSASFD